MASTRQKNIKAKKQAKFISEEQKVSKRQSIKLNKQLFMLTI